MQIQNKVAIVTGASSGIGEATARLLSEKGAKVVLAARTKEKLQALSQELPNSFSITTDMTKEDDIKKMVEMTVKHFGTVDILINNAGRGYDSTVENIDAGMFEEIFRLNLLGPALAMREVIPVMRKNGQGAIVNISSGTALMTIPQMSPYSSLKRAVVGMSLTAREELKNDKIVVSVVYPYITITDFEKNTLRSNSSEEWEGDNDIPPGDSAAFVAGKIVEAIESEEAEVFVHEWMNPHLKQE